MSKKERVIHGPPWFFAWLSGSGQPYITCICAWYRRDLVREVERVEGREWKEIMREGGRAIRCKVSKKVKI